MTDSTGSGEMRETELRRVQRKARAEGWLVGEIEYPRLRSGSPYLTVRSSADDPGVRIQSEVEWEQRLAQLKTEKERRSEESADTTEPDSDNLNNQPLVGVEKCRLTVAMKKATLLNN